MVPRSTRRRALSVSTPARIHPAVTRHRSGGILVRPSRGRSPTHDARARTRNRSPGSGARQYQDLLSGTVKFLDFGLAEVVAGDAQAEAVAPPVATTRVTDDSWDGRLHEPGADAGRLNGAGQDGPPPFLGRRLFHTPFRFSFPQRAGSRKTKLTYCQPCRVAAMVPLCNYPFETDRLGGEEYPSEA